MTLKGMSLIIVAVYVALILLRAKRVKLWHVLAVGSVLIIVLGYQFSTYLLDSTAPRAILLRYGTVTANTYFPIGSGFGTYGSDIAGKHYSALYYRYGFASRSVLLYGDRTALDDAYLAMIMGQFGWVATALMVYVFYQIGLKIIRFKITQSNEYYICLSLYACFIGMAIMAGSIKQSAGQLILFVIQLFFLRNERLRIPINTV